MKIIKFFLAVTTILLSQVSLASDDKHAAGEKLYKTYCIACHGANVGGMDMSKRIAPPIVAVRMHYISAYPDEASFVQAVSSWVEKQDANKSLMRGAIRRFNIMPPLSVPKEDIQKIAAYIYSGNIKKPQGFEKHVAEEHGKMAKGKMFKRGMGRSGQDGKMLTMMRQLNLTPQQNQQIQALLQRKNTILKTLQNEIRQINRAIQQLDVSRPDYKAQIFSLADDKAKRVYRMVIEKGGMRLKIESFLNAEQRSKYKQLRQQRRNININD